ncbi:MAG: PD40 domain-containing protein, partial [Alphaproteobacteria bacterium]|nr:PD40 domain-containing protein [Alphaproteobacteria bacterium]
MRSTVIALALLISPLACAKKKDPPAWDIESSPDFDRSLDATIASGTWMSVDVHPDGARLVFDLLGDLWTMPIEGGVAERLTEGPAWDQDPRYSPDGTKLLFVSDRDGNQELRLMDLETGEAKTITEGRPERFVEGSWSPDGRWILARKRIIDTRSIGMCELWLLPVEGGDGVQLTQTDDYPFPNEAVFSPDGEQVYFSSTPWRFQYGRDPNAGIYDLHRLDLETGEVVRLTGEAGSAFRPMVNPVTGQIALLQRKAGETVLTTFDPATGSRERLGDVVLEHDNQEGFAINGLYPHGAWTPDGRSLILWDDGRFARIDGQTGETSAIPFTAQ